jgi:hypothetical protein
MSVETLNARHIDRAGFYTAVLMVVITLITFGLAMIAIPVSGANCPANCVEYPYLDTASQYPRDFLWMPPAMILVLTYVALMSIIHTHAPTAKKVFSQIGLLFAVITGVILVADYYVQFAVVPISLISGETRGLPLLIQYNPHGIFLALEEAGYLLMSLSFLMMAPVFTGESRRTAAIRWIFLLSFVINVIALVGIALAFGLERQDRLEVIILSVNWLVLIVNGGLLAAFFRQRINAAA